MVVHERTVAVVYGNLLLSYTEICCCRLQKSVAVFYGNLLLLSTDAVVYGNLLLSSTEICCRRPRKSVAVVDGKSVPFVGVTSLLSSTQSVALVYAICCSRLRKSVAVAYTSLLSSRHLLLPYVSH